MLKVNLLGLQAVLSVSGVSFIWRVLKLTLVANKTLDVIYRNIHYLINILMENGSHTLDEDNKQKRELTGCLSVFPHYVGLYL